MIGVRTEGSGPRRGPPGAAVDDDVAGGGSVAGDSVDGEQAAMHGDCAENRYGCSGSHRASSFVVASGSMSSSVRNMKKKTTQPIAAMKIQLIKR